MDAIAGHDLAGQRGGESIGQLSATRLIDLWLRITTTIVKQGFVLEYRDLEPPRTGIFDGLRIVIDPDVGFEMQCFVLLHLFGHSVQWVAPGLESKLNDLQHTTDKTMFMEVLHRYEHEAGQYALTLLHQAGVHDLDQWFADFVATDWCYVRRYYQTNEIPPWQQCLQRGAPLIEPLPIPPLRHHPVQVRFAF